MGGESKGQVYPLLGIHRPDDTTKYGTKYGDTIEWPKNTATVTFKAYASGQVVKLTILEFAGVRGGDFKKTHS
jgi:hypothetical protein